MSRTRLTDTLLTNGQAFTAGAKAPVINPMLGGQNGFSMNPSEWLNNQNYVRRNVICQLIQAPLIFNDLPNSEYYTGTLRSLCELHAQAIDGLTQTLQVDFSTTPIGGAGEMQQDVVNVTRDRSEPSFTWPEKYNMPIARFLSMWIRMAMMDPETKVAMIATMSGKAPDDMLADRYSATMLFIEPDPTHTKVIKSWLIYNMMPSTSGDITGHRDLTQALETVTHNIRFSGIQAVGAGIDDFAQTILSGISLTGANPYQRQSFVQAIDSDVLVPNVGYARGVQQLAGSQVPL